jgi:hypothetical protein
VLKTLPLKIDRTRERPERRFSAKNTEAEHCHVRIILEKYHASGSTEFFNTIGQNATFPELL